jgi:hypothetical protein
MQSRMHQTRARYGDHYLVQPNCTLPTEPWVPCGSPLPRAVVPGAQSASPPALIAAAAAPATPARPAPLLNHIDQMARDRVISLEGRVGHIEQVTRDILVSLEDRVGHIEEVTRDILARVANLEQQLVQCVTTVEQNAQGTVARIANLEDQQIRVDHNTQGMVARVVHLEELHIRFADLERRARGEFDGIARLETRVTNLENGRQNQQWRDDAWQAQPWRTDR